MIKVEKFYKLLISNNVTFFTGVPDSLLKDFCAYITDNVESRNNIIAANEGNAVAMAAGYHLATQKFGLVYLQNSGLGNIINPLSSLTDKEIYSIPLLLLIGWRGEPNIKDEPQHKRMGKITLPILDNLEVPYKILDQDFETTIKQAVDHMVSNKSPFAIIGQPNTFEKYELKSQTTTNFEMNREQAIQEIIPMLDEKDIVVSTTGKTSRELFEYRQAKKLGHEKDFLTVGSMGHSSSIALGVALSKPSRQVYCLDGDGALIMHLGSLSVIGQLKPKNFKHIVINNFAHDSVGGQPTAADNIDIPMIAKANGYTEAFSVSTKEELKRAIQKIKTLDGPVMLEVKVNKGARKDLGRPTNTPLENKNLFIKFLKD